MTGSVDLSPAHRAIVERILAEHVPQCEVRAFGSRATWTAKDYSDLDLAIVNQESLDRTILSRLNEAFEESNLPMRVDVVDWHAISDSFREVIQRDYVVVQERTDQATTGEWKEVTLGDVCTKIGSGATPRGGKEAYVEDGPYSLIRSQNVYNTGFSHDGLAFITDEQAEALRNVEVLPDDVLLNITGDSVARVCQVDPAVLPARVNQHVAIIRTDPRKLDARYLRYFLVSPEVQSMLLSWAGSGGTRNALTKQMIESFDVRAPVDLAEQRAIAHILGTLDDKIGLNRRMNQTLEEMARALFKSWFVDFDPVHAKAALKEDDARHRFASGAEPSGNGAAPDCKWTVERARAYLDAMDPQIANLFPDRLVGSELGQIPDGWNVAGFSDVVTQLRENENPLASLETVYSHYSIPAYDDSQTPKRELGEGIKSVKTRVPSGTVLLSKLNPEIERVWLPDLTNNDRAVCSTEFLVLRPEPPFDRSYAYCLMRATAFRERLQSLVTGTSKSHQRAPARAILALEVLYPPAPILETFETAASAYLNQAVAIARDSKTLAGLRDAQLPKLLSGEMRP